MQEEAHVREAAEEDEGVFDQCGPGDDHGGGLG